MPATMKTTSNISVYMQQALQGIRLGDPDRALDVLHTLVPSLHDWALLEQLYITSGLWNAHARNSSKQVLRQDDINLYRAQTLQALMGLVKLICQQQGLDMYGLEGGVGKA